MGFSSAAVTPAGRLRCITQCMQAVLLGMAAAAMVASSVQGQGPTAAPAPVAAAPAPAPTPPYVNVTQMMMQAGDYSTFVALMVETGVDEIFQRNANQTQTGITIFVPSNEAFATKLASTLLKNLTLSHKTSLVEYHALNSWLPLGSLQLADDNQTTTLATYNNGGGRYQLNLTNDFGVVQVLSGWTIANLTSTLYSQKPVSIFAIDEVLLPDDIFGLPSPAPAPAPSSGAPTPTPMSSSKAPSGSKPSDHSDSRSGPPSSTPSITSLLVCILFLGLFTNIHL